MRIAVLITLCAAVVLPFGGPASAEEPEGLVTRLIDVSALVRGRPDFLRELEPKGPLSTYDEDAPLFGAEGEEYVHPVGQIDELMEMIRMQIEPRSWESTLGANLASIGNDILVVRQFSDVADKVQRYIATLEREVMRSVTVDIQAVRLTSEQARAVLLDGSDLLVNAGKIGEVLAPDAFGPGTAISAYDRHRCAIFAGSQHAFVGDYDVEVAQEAQVSDPIVYVDNLGMSASVRPILAADAKTCLLEIDAWLADLEQLRSINTGDDRDVEAPSYAISRLISKVQVPVGAWALVDGEAASGNVRWMFLVRAEATPVEGYGRSARGVVLESPLEKPTRRFETRVFDLGMLGSYVSPRRAEIPLLIPSNFTPPEPPELDDAEPLLPTEVIVDLLRESVAPSSWSQLEEASIESRNNRLYVRNAPDVLMAIEKNLRVLEREFLATIVTTAEVVEVDGALASELESAPGRLVSPEGLELLAAAIRAEDASRHGSVRVTTMGGARNASVNGKKIAYLSDYEVEIAQDAVIANPVMQLSISGMLLDVESATTSTDGAVDLVLRFMQTRLRDPIREVMTPHGNLEMPQLDVFRVRTALRIPVGRTVLVASTGSGDRRTLLLVTAISL